MHPGLGAIFLLRDVKGRISYKCFKNSLISNNPTLHP